MGADIPRSTLIDWCGSAVACLEPLVERIRAEVFRTDRLHVDDTPVRVLDPKVRQTKGKERGVKEGRIWTYVRDDRAWGGQDPPAVAYFFSPDRKGEHPQAHLVGFRGILQADAYSGFAKLYEAAADDEPRIREAACPPRAYCARSLRESDRSSPDDRWAHLRRDFHDVWKATGSPIAEEALVRIGALYDIERQIHGRSAEQRVAVRDEHSRPRVEAFRAWCDDQLPRIPGKGDLAKAMRYALRRWPSFTLFLALQPLAAAS